MPYDHIWHALIAYSLLGASMISQAATTQQRCSTTIPKAATQPFPTQQWKTIYNPGLCTLLLSEAILHTCLATSAAAKG